MSAEGDKHAATSAGAHDHDPADALVLAAQAAIASEGSAAHALTAIAKVRREFERIALAASGAGPAASAALAREVRPALAAAGLGALLPEGATLPAASAALARLHAHLAALTVTDQPRRERSAR